MILLVFSFTFANHPLLIGVIILILTILLATILGTLRTRTWLSYILVIVLLGGLLVIFVYVSLLAPNESQSIYNFKEVIVKSLVLITVLLVSASRFSTWTSKSNSFLPIRIEREGLNWVYVFYSQDLGPLTIFLVTYLFLTLIVVVFVRKTDSSSLRAT